MPGDDDDDDSVDDDDENGNVGDVDVSYVGYIVACTIQYPVFQYTFRNYRKWWNICKVVGIS